MVVCTQRPTVRSLPLRPYWVNSPSPDWIDGGNQLVCGEQMPSPRSLVTLELYFTTYASDTFYLAM